MCILYMLASGTFAFVEWCDVRGSSYRARIVVLTRKWQRYWLLKNIYTAATAFVVHLGGRHILTPHKLHILK